MRDTRDSLRLGRIAFRWIVVVFCWSELNGGAACACIHAAASYRDVVTEKTKQAFVFHDGKNAHLILKTELQAAKPLPSTMAWVIPLPSLPVRYTQESPKLFEELLSKTTIFYGAARGLEKNAPAAGAIPSDIIVHASRIVGDYQVQPVEIVNESGDEELNLWLERNGFGRVPPENQKFYLKKGAVFLTLKLNNLQGARVDIKPIHIVYPAKELTVPLKFSSHSGVFDLMLYAWVEGKPDMISFGNSLQDSHLSLQFGGGFDFSKPTSGRSEVARLLKGRKGYLCRFMGQGFNAPGRLVSEMSGDPIIFPDASVQANVVGKNRLLWPFLAASLLIGVSLWLRGRARVSK